MRQALLRFGSSLKRHFLIPRDKMESRLGMIGAIFGTSFLTWLLPKMVWAQTGNAATDAKSAAASVSAIGSGLASSPTVGALADAAAPIFNIVATMAASFLYLIIYALIFVNTLITDLMIRVAQYNNFVNAKPVQMGWPLIRDVCNMFFIVVLLLIAFSTIIGYKPFHFKDNLPKLLLYAVLINFSRTLIGLLIDFSQVVMLTFVVGFKDAAFGNFAKAFQVPNLLSLNAQAFSGGGGGLATTSNIIVALIFGIWIMTIAMTALVIMLIYFIARIISLWVLLILSPLAFFALGVPSKIAGALGPVSSFWKQLSAWLTGGPVVAFFLWLALAVIQSSDSPFADVGGVGKNTQEEAAVQAVITDIGKPENVLNFIVSVAFMLIGVKTAVEVSQQANPMLGSMAKNLSSGGGVAWKTAKAIPKAPRAAAKVASYVPGTQGLARYANQKAAQGGVGGVIARGTGAGAFGGMVLQEKGLREEDRKKMAGKRLDEKTKGLGESDAANRLTGIQKTSGALDWMRKKAGFENYEPGLAVEKGAMLAMSKNGAKAIGKDIEATGRGKKLNKDQMAAVKASQVKQNQMVQLADAEKFAKEAKNDDLLDKIKEERQKDPGLFQIQKLGTEIGGIDPKGIKPDAWGDNAVFLAYMKDKGLVDNDGKLVAGYKDSASWKGISSGNGNGAKLVRAQAAKLENPAGQADARTILAGIGDKATEDQIKAAEAKRSISKISGNGKDVYSADWIQPSSGSFKASDAKNYADTVGESRDVTGFTDLVSRLPEATRERIETAFGGSAESRDARASRFASPLSDTQAAVISAAIPAMSEAAGARSFTPAHVAQMYQAQAAGVNTGHVGLYPDTGAADPATEEVIKKLFEQAFEDASSGDGAREINAAQFMANIDMRALRQGGGAAEKITTSFAANLATPAGVDSFKTAYNKASGNQQQAIELRIREIVQSAENAREKSMTDRSAFEAQAIKFQDQLMSSSDKEMKRIARGKGKKG